VVQVGRLAVCPKNLKSLIQKSFAQKHRDLPLRSSHRGQMHHPHTLHSFTFCPLDKPLESFLF
jgi:hypothetical protein